MDVEHLLVVAATRECIDNAHTHDERRGRTTHEYDCFWSPAVSRPKIRSVTCGLEVAVSIEQEGGKRKYE